MVKLFVMVLGLWLSQANSALVKEDALRAKQNAIDAMSVFNPATALNGYTSTPPESQISATENRDPLNALGLTRAKQDKTAMFVVRQQAHRARIIPNPKSVEMEYAQKLIDGADAVTGGACYKQPVPCIDKLTQKTCEEKAEYSEIICASETLHVSRRIHHHAAKTRLAFIYPFIPQDKIDLRACRAGEVITILGVPVWQCSEKEIFTPTPACDKLDIKVTYADGRPITVLTNATCNSPVLVLQKQNATSEQASFIHIQVTEYEHFKDTWEKHDCAKDIEKKEFCVLDKANVCVEPNATKIINGEPVKRPCWGRASYYQCTNSTTNNCAPLLAAGCSHISSACTAYTHDHCDNVLQTFQCPERTCFPDKTVCPGDVSCANGSCDDTVTETSDDIAEGLSRLGSLAGTAEDVTTNQIDLGQARIFAGAPQECERHLWGVNDCCKGKGWGDWIVHCPKNLQVLKKAKLENRVVSLGKYKHKGSTKYVYCVFPTKLAAIIQIQGRGDQLHIPFGKPKTPDCRGVTPEELERINFDNVQLGDLVNEWAARKTIPDSAAIERSLTEHVERLESQGVAHD